MKKATRLNLHVGETHESMSEVIANLPITDELRASSHHRPRATRLATRRRNDSFKPGETEDRPFRTLTHKFVSMTDVVNDDVMAGAAKRCPPSRSQSTSVAISKSYSSVRRMPPSRCHSSDEVPLSPDRPRLTRKKPLSPKKTKTTPSEEGSCELELKPKPKSLTPSDSSSSTSSTSSLCSDS